MRFRRRRRGPRVQWLPMPGTQLENSIPPGTVLPVPENPAALEFIFNTDRDNPVTVSAPLVVDNPIGETVAGTSVATWQNLALNQTNEFGWRLRRIVGDIFFSALNLTDQSPLPPGALVQAGIIVRRVGQDGQPTAQAAQQDVGSIQNESDPWVWRRNWVLSNGTAIAGGNGLNNVNQFPPTNIAYGTKHHIAIDQKTNRRLGPEERLFLTVTAWEIPLNATNVAQINQATGPLTIYGIMPYRVLGTVITSAGNRRNASR